MSFNIHKTSTSGRFYQMNVPVTFSVITNGNYYTGSNGTGTLLHAGDLIEKVEPIIFLAVLIQNLYQQSSFAVTLIAEYSIKLNYCGVLSYHKLPLAISVQATVLQEQVKYYQRVPT
jgi:hypothetical protein